MEMPGVCDAIMLEVTVEKKGNAGRFQIWILPFWKKVSEKYRKNRFIFMFKDSKKREWLRDFQKANPDHIIKVIPMKIKT